MLSLKKRGGALLACAPSVLGKSSFKALTINGAVMMKMTSKTIITSTKGVTLMSLMGVWPGVRSKRPKAIRALADRGQSLPALAPSG